MQCKLEGPAIFVSVTSFARRAVNFKGTVSAIFSNTLKTPKAHLLQQKPLHNGPVSVKISFKLVANR